MTSAEEQIRYNNEQFGQAVQGHINRGNQLSDIASQRQYEQTSADTASKRRQKEFTESERQRLIQKYAEIGVEVKSDDTLEQANAKFRKFQENRAGNLLDHFNSNIGDVTDRKKDVVTQLQHLASKKADGLTAREALTVTLANPAAVKDIPSDQLAKLKAVLNGPGEPDKVVQKVYDYMANDYWFRKGAAQNRASAFYQTYLTELNSRLKEGKQIDAALLMSQLNDLEKEGYEVIKKRDDLIASAAPFLTKDQIKSSHDTHPVAPPVNPADAFKDMGIGSVSTDAPPKSKPIPVPSADVGPPPINQANTMEGGGLYGAFKGMVEKGIIKGGDAIANLADNTSAYFEGLDGQPALFDRDVLGPSGESAPAPKAVDVLGNRAAVNARVNPSTTPMPATPAEVEQVKALARSMGVDPDKGADKFNSQDPRVKAEAIASFNVLLKKVRDQARGINTNSPAAAVGGGYNPASFYNPTGGQ